MSNNPINSCDGFFYDSGGSVDDYSSDESFTTVICADPGNPAGTHVQLVFSAVDISPGDQMCFYDGIDVTANQLSCHDDFMAGSPFIIQATAANTSGCITVTFNSDSADESAGWQADMNCVAACQTIQAVLVGSDPPVSPVDTGYIDVCPNERVFFYGAGAYPQDGLVYSHSDLTSSFEWDFGDGTFGLGPNVSHVYSNPGGYIVQLTITDQFGCLNTNFISQRVRVSTHPSFNIFGDFSGSLCAGDTINLNAVVGSQDSTFNVGVAPTEGSFPTAGFRSDSLALPDGTGSAYETSIGFTNFSPGQVLTNIDDLVQICVIMEHSYLRDLEISISCPNGQSITLHNFGGQSGGPVFLGIPNENDENLPAPIPGTGFEYCWTPNATNGTWLEYANTTGVGTLPSGDYNSFDPLSDLLGCPLNGEWTISVQDLWAIDNGFIFEWSIEFDASLYPNIETFTPEIVDFGWVDNPSIFFQTQDSIAASPQNAGTGSYIFEVTDNFGCTYDTSLTITVLPPTHPDCFTCPDPMPSLTDASICEGDLLQLDATNTTALASQEIGFESFPTYAIGNSNHPNTNPYEAPIQVTSMTPLLITDAPAQICGVCVDLDTDFDADIRMYLRSPNGQLLELSTQNGGAGDNYTGTCFSPMATTPIVGSAAPFTGQFMPEGDWTDLNGSAINGTWHLLVSDDFGLSMGELKSWSICFNLDNDIEYQWTPAMGLTCDDCPDPVASPTTTTTYNLNISDQLGCNYTESMTIEVGNNIPAPANVNCESVPGGNLQITWDAVTGFTNYEININGTGWLPVTGNLTHIIGGLTIGDDVSYEIRVISTNLNCVLDSFSSSCTYQLCLMQVSLNGTTPPSCFNSADGTASVNAVSGMLPYMYSLNGQPAQNLPVFGNVPAGNNVIFVEDGEGCLDSVEFTIVNTANPISIDFLIDSVACNGTDSGNATAIANGGSGGFNYTWNTSPIFTFDETIANVAAGQYFVTATDANNCQFVDSIMIFEPEVLSATIAPTDNLCNEGTTGVALATPTGGTGPYSYMWSNGGLSAEINSLVAGTYSLTVTDAKNCTFELETTIAEPSGMVIQIDSFDVNCFNAFDGQILLDVVGGAMPYTFLWDDGSTLEDRMDLGEGTHCVTITDNNNCDKIRCVTLDQPTELTASVVSTPTTCANNNTDGTATVVPIGGTGTNYTFLWSDNNSQTTGMAQNLSPGNYCVTVTDENQCTTTACIEVNSPTDILVDNIVPTDVLCFGENSGTAEVFATGGFGNYTYLWSDPLSQFANPANSLTAGTYTVTITDEIGCTVTASVTVDEPEILDATTSVTNVNCFQGSDGTATVMPTGGIEPYTYLWGPGPFQTDQTATNLSDGNATVTVTDYNGCTVEATVTISSPATAVTASVSQTHIGCFGANDSEATVVASGGTGTNYTYLWSNIPVSITATATGLPPQETFVTVIDENGCEAFDTLMIDELDEISINLIQVQPSCFGLTDGQIGVNIVNGGIGNGNLNNYNYLWENNSVNPLNANIGTGNYVVTVSDAQGCSNTASLFLDQPDEILTSATIQDALCFGSSDGEISVTASGTFDSFTYQWDGNTNNQITSTASNLPAGTYNVVVTDSTGCTTNADFAITEPEQIAIEFATEDNLCSFDTIGTITTTITGGTPDYNYNWINTNPGSPFTATTNNIEELYAGMYALTITDANGCMSIDSVEVTSPPSLWAETETDDVTCFGDSDGYIHVEAQGGSGPFQFSIDGTNFSPSKDFLGLSAGGYTVYIQDANGCEYEIFNEINSPEEVTVDLGDNITINYGEVVQLNAEVYPAGTYTYEWSPRDSLNCVSCETNPSPIAVGLSNQTSYSVEVMNEFGCTAKDYVTVLVLKSRRVFVPTGFSPNSDSNNDILRTHGELGTTIKSFKVFDRWGEMVYENPVPYDINEPNVGWNGRFKGTLMNPGVYVWVMEVEYSDGAKDIFKGNTTLIR